MCLSTRTLFPPNKHFVSLLSVSLWKFISTKLKGQGLATGCWSSGRDSVPSLPRPDFNLWPGAEILPQAEAT